MAGSFHRGFRETIRWTLIWAAFGLILGVALMFDKVDIIAESGSKLGVIWYSFWIPLGIAMSALLGFAFGAVFATLIGLTGYWREPFALRQNLSERYGRGLLFGAFAGSALGWRLPATYWLLFSSESAFLQQ